MEINVKVYIGPYKNYIGPYQIADMVFFWCEKYPEDENVKNRWDYRLQEKFGDFLAQGFSKDRKHTTWFANILIWIESKRKRKVKIRIDKYDTWNFDSTLSPIILPMLKQLKETKHGSGFVDLEDVPEHLRYTDNDEDWQWHQPCFDFYKETKEKLDCDIHTRYDWLLDELIWTFEQLQPDCDWEKQYWIESPEFDFSVYPEDEGQQTVPVRWLKEGVCDWDGRKKHEERIHNGLILFGKYFKTLWD